MAKTVTPMVYLTGCALQALVPQIGIVEPFSDTALGQWAHEAVHLAHLILVEMEELARILREEADDRRADGLAPQKPDDPDEDF